MSKITNRLIELKEYQETRGENTENDFLLTITGNLLENLGYRINIFHEKLDHYRSKKIEIDNKIKISLGQYICSLITCWETFFRDLFIFIINQDSTINHRLKLEINDEIPMGLTLGEFCARKYNFQNLNQTREAFDYLFDNKTIELSDYFSNEVFNGLLFLEDSILFDWIEEEVLKTKLDETLHTAFRIRHRVTHDANYLLDVDFSLLAKIECVFQSIPQFFAAHIAKRYSQRSFVFNKIQMCIRITDNPTQDEVPFIFSVKDFTANDWHILE
jgi:hypothetical protein